MLDNRNFKTKASEVTTARLSLTLSSAFNDFVNLISICRFRRHVDEICILLGCYAASIGNSVPTLRDNIVPISSGQEVQISFHLSPSFQNI
jgi:hypothetical protein